MWKLTHSQITNGSKEEGIKREIKKYLETNKNRSTTDEILWDTAKELKEGKLKQYTEKRKVSKEQPKFIAQGTRTN